MTGVFLTATSLAAVRWAEDYHLFILGALSFAAAYLGREARRHRWRNWARLHLIGMGTSYILLLTAFYVDNGNSLPLWRELPPIDYWLVPAAVGMPLIIRALLWHPLARAVLRRSDGRWAARLQAEREAPARDGAEEPANPPRVGFYQIATDELRQ